jgi:hypothetical protein
VSDPRVDSLNYTFVVEEGHDFSSAPPLDVRLANFACRLEVGELVARPSVDYARAVEAREVLEPRLSAWEAAAEIAGAVRIRFEFSGAEVVDLDPDSMVVPQTVSMGGQGGLGVVPDHVVHPGHLGGWGCQSHPSPRRTPDEAAP